jgi:DNA-binding GntR family transcriptional regulator
MTAKKAVAPTKSNRPRYAEIAELLATEIAQGRRSVGTFLPTEHELSAEHEVSRATVREALRQLQARGLISRNQGVGTRVLARDARTNYVLAAQTVTETMGYAAETHFVVKQRRMVRATPALARTLGTAAGTEWLHLSGHRLLTAEPDRPLALSTIYVAARYAALADKSGGAGPIYALIERERRVKIAEITQDITALILSGAQAKQLRTEPGSAGLHVLRRFVAPDGQPVEVTRNVHPADRFSFSLRLHPPPG